MRNWIKKLVLRVILRNENKLLEDENFLLSILFRVRLFSRDELDEEAFATDVTLSDEKRGSPQTAAEHCERIFFMANALRNAVIFESLT